MTQRDVFWWEYEREWAKQGWYAKPKGRDEKILCPKCGLDYVVYNGNYFCDSWVYREGRRLTEGECDWALAHPSITKRDRDICDLIGIDYF